MKPGKFDRPIGDRYLHTFRHLKERSEGAFVPFVVLGDPDFFTSREIIKTLIDSGADMLELGIPFSDPIADGPTIQTACQRALDCGMNTEKAFTLIQEIREYRREIPVGLLVYSNLIYSYGIEKFYSEAQAAGADSILAADLPVEEARPFLSAANLNCIAQIFLATPATHERRLRKIVRSSSAFIYVVSLLGVTGARGHIDERAFQIIGRIRKFTHLPLLTGFGLSKPTHVKPILAVGSDGLIVGSALIELIACHRASRRRLLREISELAKAIKAETRNR